MYLESLEMAGFKSFATKTVLHFHRGVTAIVGPNGCGKSNVLDAIRWVLGEQSAKALRGGEMADVIFGGTDSRSPLGMAEVSLTFSECEKELGVEWSQVQITRRVHRDGKSEYFINRAPCRLKDIHQLFMDTGVGRSAYSIMEQGKIDLILSSRPEDRRSIFEEAAGITKYKAQKKEALRKLEYTEANLLRVQDIIKEVNRQIGSLQRQAAKARRYQVLISDLRTFDTHLSHRNFQQLQTATSEVRASISRIDEARTLHEQQTSQQENELSALRAQLADQESEGTRLRSTLEELRNRAFSAQSRIETNSERAAEGRELVARHRNDISAAEEKINIQQGQIEETDHQIAGMIEALRVRESELRSHEEAVEAARAERQKSESTARQLSTSIAEIEARVASLRNEVSLAATRREASGTRLEVLRAECENSSQAGVDAAARVSEIQSRKASMEQKLAEARELAGAAQSALEESELRRQQLDAEFNRIAKDAAALESRLEVLRQLQQRGEGFDEGTQALLKGLDDPPLFQASRIGLLADAITVDPQYIPAIEAALGTLLEAVLFKDEVVTRSAAERLSTGRMGRAAAIPRQWIGEHHGHPRAELARAPLAWASDVIVGETEGATLARRVLADVAIVDSLQNAFALRSSAPHVQVVTMAGELIDRFGVVHAGSPASGESPSSLARKAEILKLDTEFAARLQSMEQLEHQREEIHAEIGQRRESVASARERLQSIQVGIASTENEMHLAMKQQTEQAERLAGFRREMCQIEESLKTAEQKLTSLEEEISTLAYRLDDLRNDRSLAEQSLEASRVSEVAASEAFNEVRVSVATSKEQHDSLARQRGPMAARLAELAELVESRRSEIARYERRIGELLAESEQNREAISEIEGEQARVTSQLESVTSQSSDLRGQIEAIESALRSSRTQLTALQDEKGRLEVRLAQLEMKAENLRNHVSQRYQTDLTAFDPDTYALISAYRERIKKMRSPAVEAMGASAEHQTAESSTPDTESPEGGAPVPWNHIEEMVAELTERVESMGPVNLEAIQEFEELEERQLFLEKQNADLVKSKVDLLEVISKINTTTRELFSETFAKVRENFQFMYQELFGGGAANLMLVDESDPLESGIEIIAKPPGKQLKSVSLLSGGERTMTAVALLFGIYMVKPSPFCVLDEMDAPLDESNIARFIKILDRFVDQSQFVVITHNKRTISRAEMLYGVTMEEHGVSKLVSVKFTSGEDSKNAPSVAESLGKRENLQPAAGSLT